MLSMYTYFEVWHQNLLVREKSEVISICGYITLCVHQKKVCV